MPNYVLKITGLILHCFKYTVVIRQEKLVLARNHRQFVRHSMTISAVPMVLFSDEGKALIKHYKVILTFIFSKIARIFTIAGPMTLG